MVADYGVGTESGGTSISERGNKVSVACKSITISHVDLFWLIKPTPMALLSSNMKSNNSQNFKLPFQNPFHFDYSSLI